MPLVTVDQWDSFLEDFPVAHLLQTGLWGALKAEFGWQVAHFIAGRAGAQVLTRRLPLGFSLAYLPRGPVGDRQDWPALWLDIDRYCRSQRAILLKVEPDEWLAGDMESVDSHPPGFLPGVHSIQPPRTLLVDLAGSEAEILARMKQKTRYNIRLAQRKGVTVRASDDLEIFQRLMLETGERDAFGVHSQAYYRRVYQLFHPAGQCELLLADYAGQTLAAIMVFARGPNAWYFYGASSGQHREVMPTYLLQWEAMRWARARGCQLYDLWGVPDESEQELEAQFVSRSDGLWGVYRFKRGFGGRLARVAGPWDRPYMPLLYRLYSWWVQRRAT